MTTATRAKSINNSKKQSVVSFPVKPLPQARNLSIEGIDKRSVFETRIATMKTTRSKKKPAAQCLAKKETIARKLPEASFRLIETEDTTLEIIMTAKSVKSALKKGETVLLASPEQSEQLIRKISMTGFDAQPYIESDQLVIFNSLPVVHRNLDQMTCYREIFGELFTLAGGPVDRVIILQMDRMVNLKSDYLATATISKFTQAADEMGCKFVAQYSRSESVEQIRLERACNSLVNAYFSMTRGEERKNFQLRVKNDKSIVA